ncbi:MAG: hydrogenase maturation protease [Planctomycetota bacterium]|nr:hydrogenase maturation protease [Planctomycetota bacterium]
MTDTATVLVLGYGNPGRRDDGLGPALAAALEKSAISQVTVDSDYQLMVEDAAAAAEHDVVIFVDASINCDRAFTFKRIEPKAEISFSSHSVSPESVLGLAHKLFGAETKGYILSIRGYEFEDMQESLTEAARANLDAALDFLQTALYERTFREV